MGLLVRSWVVLSVFLLAGCGAPLQPQQLQGNWLVSHWKKESISSGGRTTMEREVPEGAAFVLQFDSESAIFPAGRDDSFKLEKGRTRAPYRLNGEKLTVIDGSRDLTFAIQEMNENRLVLSKGEQETGSEVFTFTRIDEDHLDQILKSREGGFEDLPNLPENAPVQESEKEMLPFPIP